MEDHSKREGLEIFNLDYIEKRFCLMFSLKTVGYLSNVCFFHEKNHVTCHVIYDTTFMLRNVKDDKIISSAKISVQCHSIC